MTDQELLAALAEKTPDELSEEEISYLRRRLSESSELREALLSQVQMESYLAAALGRVNFSTADIVRRAEQHSPGSSGAAAIYVGIPLVLLAAVGMLFLFREAIWGPRDRQVADVPAKVVDAAKQKQTDHEKAAADQDERQGAKPVENSAPGSEPIVELPPETPPPAPAADAKTQPAAPAVPPAPVVPWQSVMAQEGDLPSFEEVAFRPFDVARQLPRRTDLLAWFEAVPGHNHRITEVDTPRGKCGQLEGLARLKAPWTGDSVLRLSLENYNRLQLHFYSGSVGTTLVYYEDQQFKWAAYATARQAGKARPQTLAVTATDDDRAKRTELRAGGPIEIRHRGSELILSRGNIVLLSAPLAGPPDDVYFDGRVAFHGLELARTLGDPQPLPLSPVVFDTTRPADLNWTSSKPAIAQAELEPDGSVRLAADNAKERVECFAPLPAAGLCELIVELEDVTPGTSLYLGGEQGNVLETVRFHLDRRSKQLAVRVRGNDDAFEDQFDDYKERPAPLVGPHCFVRLLYGAGNLRWWLSSDGLHWAQLDFASAAALPNRRTIGLQVVANRAGAQVTLKRFVLRELSGLAALAAKEVRDRAAGFPEARSLGDWLAAVAPLTPAGVDPGQWRRACAIRTLGLGAHQELAYGLLELLLDDAAARELPADQQLAALNDAMLLAMDLRDGGAMRLGLTNRYLRLGRETWDRDGQRAWSTIQHAAMSVPVVSHQQQTPAIESNLRWELIDAVTRRTPSETADLCRQLRFFQLQQQLPLLEWAEATARREVPAATSPQVARIKDGWRPPLVEEVSKETYSSLNDVRAVVESEAWDDAAQMITSLPSDAGGVASWPADKDLMVSLPVGVQMTLANHPPLRSTVEANYAPLARLRIAQAIAAGDVAAVELAAVQFAGTESAAEAHRWLADQALASGWFERAIAEYQRAAELFPALADQLAPRIRLAAAMLGRDAGQPAADSIRLGEVTLTKEQFEALVAEMRSRPSALLSVGSDAQAAPLFPPAGLQAQVKSRLDGNVGDKPQEEVVRRTNQFRVPWVDRQIATALEGDLLYVANRFQVTAYNLVNGQRQWISQPPPGPMKPAQDWAMIAMRPLVTPQHIFVRQLYGPSPQLVCLNKLDGKIVWTTMLSDREFLVSDPLLVQGQLVELSIELAEGQEGILRWNKFDPATGQLQEQRDLVRLRSTWGAHACCEVAALDDSLVAALGGVTVAVDAAGRLKWLRKQTVLPGDEDPRWILQRYQPPLVDGERIYVAQPGVRAVECIDARTGARHWLAVIPDALAICGLIEGRLIVWTENELRALDAASGKTLWRHAAATDLHSFQLCSTRHVLYSRREPMPNNTASIQTRFVWLDPATGLEQGSAIVPQLADADPRLGPLVLYKDRIVSFFGKGQHDPNRDVIEIWPKGEPEPPQLPLAADQLWLRHLPPELAAASAKALPKWQLLSGQIGERTGILPEAHGERDLLGVRTNPQWPIAFASPVEIPAGARPKLRLRVGNDAGHDWKIEVRFGDRVVQAIDVTEQAYPDRWKTLEVDLSSLAGQSGTLVVCGRFVKGGGDQTVTFWKTLEVVL